MAQHVLREDNVATLTEARDMNAEELVNILVNRYERRPHSQPYTNIGERFLVAMNPFGGGSCVNGDSIATSDESALRYVNDYRDTSASRLELAPSIFKTSELAYLHMRQTGLNQSLIFMGESGSGKTEQRRLALRFFSLLRTHSKKDTKLFLRLQSVDTIIQAFSNARTTSHMNASRVGLYTELQFDDRGRTIGMKVLPYLLEKARVTSVPQEERNFHVFYSMIYGASNEDRTQFGIPTDLQAFDYLQRPGTGYRSHTTAGFNAVGQIPEQFEFTSLCSTMKSIGLHKRYQRHIFAVIGAILCLGNLQFDYQTQEGFDSAVVRNTELLNQVSKVLGVDPVSLETALANKTQTVGGESCTVYLDAKGATARRDELARALYSLLFNWLIEFINGRFCRDDDERDSFISMLDFPGSQGVSLRRNGCGYEQLCLNYAAERINHFIMHQVFEAGNDEYRTENIVSIPSISFSDRSGCLELFVRSNSGLFTIMDRQAGVILGKDTAAAASGGNGRPGKKGGKSAKRERSTSRAGSSLTSLAHEFDPDASSRVANFQLLSAFNKGNAGKGGERNQYYQAIDSKNEMNSFTINHYWGDVVYDIDGFVDKNLDQLSSDFVALFRGDGSSAENSGSRNGFIAGLFTDKSIATEVHPRNEKTVVQAQALAVPVRAPSMMARASKSRLPAVRLNRVSCLATQFNRSINELITTLDETLPWFVICIKSNEQSKPRWADARKVLSAVRAYSLASVVRRKTVEFSAAMLPSDFCERYENVIAERAPEAARSNDPFKKCLALKQSMGLTDAEMSLGTSKVFMSYRTWRRIDDPVRTQERSAAMAADNDAEHEDETAYSQGNFGEKGSAGNSSRNLHANNGGNVSFNINGGGLGNDSQGTGDTYESGGKGRSRGGGGYDNDTRSFYSDDEAYQDLLGKDTFSDVMSEGGFQTGFSDILSTGSNKEDDRDGKDGDGDSLYSNGSDGKPGMTKIRRVWLFFVKIMTWMVPDKMIKVCAGRKRKDEQIAWREKLTLCMMIFWNCAFVVFWIAGLGLILCPHQNVYSIEELQDHNTDSDALIAIRGEVFDIEDFVHMNIDFDYIVNHNYLGRDLSELFPLQLSFVCPFDHMDPRLATQPKPVLYSEAYYHDHRWWRSPTEKGYNYYQYRLMRRMREGYSKGHIAVDPGLVRKQAAGTAKGNDEGKNLIRCIINGEVFDLTDYVAANGAPYVVVPDGQSNSSSFNRQFLDSNVMTMFQDNKGEDITDKWNRYFSKDVNMRNLHYQCLRGAFYVGKVDKRKSARCYAANYLLLAASIALTSVIFFKFIAALQLGSSREPEPGDRFVLMNVPCYTEGEESLKNTIDSLAKTRYDDKRKLLFIVCDGMIMGSGNDRPTPRIVLDILGVDHDQDTEALSYIALGEGSKVHNMAKVYSGLYEVSGHVVPYLVIAKCGTPRERTRPGNRGKRDSQIMLMGFFNKVHFDLPMTPLELEIYHQIKNVIGVSPTHYEYVLMIDADTVVLPDSLNRLVRVMLHDIKIMGLCGETKLGNAKSSWITMMQVYEYFISHHLTKAFESLFGSVTCLPGCFCMYRLRSVDGRPLLIANDIISEYSENNVDTLHKKNLLHLGEDRYLTTLMLKHFPYFKNKFTCDAQCMTNAPDSWKVLMSQRRRWINSTVHNLFELVFLPQMCGFCCFSMRFVVFIDLISTIITPATMVYLAYLVYQLTNPDFNTSYISLYLLAAVYGMQVIIFVLKRQWQHIGWMILHLLAIPFFTLVLPLYAFWHFDDFSWGNTRVVVGESGRKHVYTVDNEKFDTSTIPVRKWSDYEQELMWDSGTPSQPGSDMGSRLGSRLDGGPPVFGGAAAIARPGSAIGNLPKSMNGIATTFGSNGGGIPGVGIGASAAGYTPSNHVASMYVDSGVGYTNVPAANIPFRGSGITAVGSGDMTGRTTPVLSGTISPPQVYSGDTYEMMSYAASAMSPPLNHSTTNLLQQPQQLQPQFQQTIPPPVSGYGGIMGVAATAVTPIQPAYDPRTSQLMTSAAGSIGPINGYQQGTIVPGTFQPQQQQQMMMANDVFTNASNDAFGSQAQEAAGANGAQQYRSGVTNGMIAAHIAHIFLTIDLVTATKKQVREQVANDLGIGPDEVKLRREFINSCIAGELAKRGI